MSDDDISGCLDHYRVPTDRPLIVQVSRFDRWKDPVGVIEAFRRAREQVDCTLVLVGNSALDDPEGSVILETIQGSIDERIIVLTVDDVNALQRRADIVLQKSTQGASTATTICGTMISPAMNSGPPAAFAGEHILGDFLAGNVVEIVLLVADLVGVPQRHPEEAFSSRLERDDVFPGREDHLPERDHPLFLDRLTDHLECLLAYFAVPAVAETVMTHRRPPCQVGREDPVG
jgi:hypothetical protein